MSITTSPPPEYNVTGQDYKQRGHLRFGGPIIDIHAHVMLTRPGDPPSGPPLGTGPDASSDQAATMLEVASDFGIVQTYSMCLPADIPILRARFGSKLEFNGSIIKKKIDDPDDDAYRLLDEFLKQGVKIIKFWGAPRGRERGLLLDTPWRIESARRALAAGVRVFMVHCADPDVWFQNVYADATKFGTKPDQYRHLQNLLERFPEATWIAAHMGGDPEHPDHLEELLVKYPHLRIDTSATKWQVREVSPRRQAIRDLICRHPGRFLFGVDLVTRHQLTREHYVRRYWCQRTLWEGNGQGRSPIADPDYKPREGEPATPLLHGVDMPDEVLQKVYHDNALALFR
ncbi:MAG: amidohydrolase family protein [Gemmataceae bacterium]